MGWLTRLFGQSGKVRFEGTMADGTTFSGTTKIEVFNMDASEVESWLKESLYVETGRKVKELRIVAFAEE